MRRAVDAVSVGLRVGLGFGQDGVNVKLRRPIPCALRGPRLHVHHVSLRCNLSSMVASSAGRHNAVTLPLVNHPRPVEPPRRRDGAGQPRARRQPSSSSMMLRVEQSPALAHPASRCGGRAVSNSSCERRGSPH